MRRTIIVVLVLIIAATAVSAQSLMDDPTYKAMIDQIEDLEEQAETAINEGRYDDAVELAEQAEELADQAETYAEQRVLGYVANGWVNRARNRVQWAEGVQAATRYPSEYTLATGHLADAEMHFRAAEYVDAIQSARLAVSALEDVQRPVVTAPEPEPEPVTTPEPEPVTAAEPEPTTPVATEPVLPAQYIVELNVARRDCLWRIAEFDFVYGDPWRWTVLYEANRDKLPDPENPDWIEPGMVIDIPSIAGEERSGIWNPEAAGSANQ